jgi:hypothetical protein
MIRRTFPIRLGDEVRDVLFRWDAFEQAWVSDEPVSFKGPGMVELLPCQHLHTTTSVYSTAVAPNHPGYSEARITVCLDCGVTVSKETKP